MHAYVKQQNKTSETVELVVNVDGVGCLLKSLQCKWVLSRLFGSADQFSMQFLTDFNVLIINLTTIFMGFLKLSHKPLGSDYINYREIVRMSCQNFAVKIYRYIVESFVKDELIRF